jgi:hypothetical protein
LRSFTLQGITASMQQNMLSMKPSRGTLIAPETLQLRHVRLAGLEVERDRIGGAVVDLADPWPRQHQAGARQQPAQLVAVEHRAVKIVGVGLAAER